MLIESNVQWAQKHEENNKLSALTLTSSYFVLKRRQKSLFSLASYHYTKPALNHAPDYKRPTRQAPDPNPGFPLFMKN